MCNIKRQKVTNDAARSEHGVFCTSPWLDQFGGEGWGVWETLCLPRTPLCSCSPPWLPPGPPAFTAALPLRSHFTSTPKCTHWGPAAAPRLPGPAHGGPFRAKSRGHSRVLDTTGLTLLVETPLSLRISGVTLPIPAAFSRAHVSLAGSSLSACLSMQVPPTSLGFCSRVRWRPLAGSPPLLLCIVYISATPILCLCSQISPLSHLRRILY